MNDDLKRLTPTAKIRSLEDGSLMVTVGEFRSIVSSHHLVEPKIIRLTSYWMKAHGHDGDHIGHQV
jgi:hypothetical protein|tara:strand:- start:38 stop:235 length:198 start_codon:yes stop_codon:yes gene_type:complete